MLHCPTCYSTDFKISRLRPEDRLRKLTFKLPVRCKKCNLRVYASRAFAKSLENPAPASELKPVRS